MYEAPTMIGTCINCIAPGSLTVTFAVIAVGVAIALQAERRKTAHAKRPSAAMNKAVERI